MKRQSYVMRQGLKIQLKLAGILGTRQKGFLRIHILIRRNQYQKMFPIRDRRR